MKINIIVSILLCILFCNIYAQKAPGYVINGTIQGLPDGKEFYLVKSTNAGKPDTISRTRSKNGKFKFFGNLALQGEHHFLKMDTAKMGRGKNKSYVTLFLDNSNISIEGTLVEWPNVKISGSDPTDEYKELIALIEKNEISTESQTRWIKEGKDSLSMVKAKDKYRQVLIGFITTHLNSYTSPYLLIKAYKTIGSEDVNSLTAKLTTKVQNSFWGHNLNQQITTFKGFTGLEVGKILPDFLTETPEGTRIYVKELIKSSKYTLIDFWAWWCKPCLEDIPSMKKAYAAFHDKGFNIVSVSSDPNMAKWKKALAEEGTPWINVMQVENVSKIIFGFGAIPAYILVNEKGEMLAYDAPISGFKKSTPKSAGTMNGSQVYLKDSTKTGLRGDDLYQVIEGLLGKAEVKK